MNNLSVNDVTDKHIRNLTTKFDIGDILIKNHRLLNVYWMPKMHKKPH